MSREWDRYVTAREYVAECERAYAEADMQATRADDDRAKAQRACNAAERVKEAQEALAKAQSVRRWRESSLASARAQMEMARHELRDTDCGAPLPPPPPPLPRTDRNRQRHLLEEALVHAQRRVASCAHVAAKAKEDLARTTASLAAARAEGTDQHIRMVTRCFVDAVAYQERTENELGQARRAEEKARQQVQARDEG